MKKNILFFLLGAIMFSSITAFAATNGTLIEVFYTINDIVINSKSKMPDQKPFAYNGTTYVPLRFVAETLGYEVGWDGHDRVIYLTLEDDNTNIDYDKVMKENKKLQSKIDSYKEQIEILNEKVENLQSSIDSNSNSSSVNYLDDQQLVQVILYDRNDEVRYEGTMKNKDAKKSNYNYNGYGTSYTTDGEIWYEGEWKDGKYNGIGSLYINGQLSYEGEWKDGKKNGNGIDYDTKTNNVVYVGQWEDNKKNGMGIQYRNNEIIYEGEWKDSRRQGYGILYNTNRFSYPVVEYIGQFEDGYEDSWGLYFDYYGNFEYEGIRQPSKQNQVGANIQKTTTDLSKITIPEDAPFSLSTIQNNTTIEYQKSNNVSTTIGLPYEEISGVGDSYIRYDDYYPSSNNGGFYIDGNGNIIYK